MCFSYLLLIFVWVVWRPHRFFGRSLVIYSRVFKRLFFPPYELNLILMDCSEDCYPSQSVLLRRLQFPLATCMHSFSYVNTFSYKKDVANEKGIGKPVPCRSVENALTFISVCGRWTDLNKNIAEVKHTKIGISEKLLTKWLALFYSAILKLVLTLLFLNDVVINSFNSNSLCRISTWHIAIT